MGKLHDGIDASALRFIEAQRMFFVATAPLSGDGHINLSPKGLDTFRVLGPRRVAYLDYVGSGAETIAHLTENGRVVIMFCAFDGPPNILRLYGRGHVVIPASPEFHELRPLFPSGPNARAIITVDVESVSDTCGFGVPLYTFEGERTQLPAWAERKGPAGLETYQVEKNAESLDGLPAVTWLGKMKQ